MKKKRLISFVLAASVTLGMAPAMNVSAAAGVPMYRMYNAHSGEHFYTKNAAERNSLLVAGWDYEGIGWTAPTSGRNVYRLYNRNSGDHHYTTSRGERNALIRLGWKSEGVGWQSGGTVPVYRQYNPNAKTGTHNYTTSKTENAALQRLGWKVEGVCWYGVANPSRGKSSVPDGSYYVELTTGKKGIDTMGSMNNLSCTTKRMTFTGQVYKGGNERLQPFGNNRSFDFRFADDCLYYIQPTDVSPREIISANTFMTDSREAWKAAKGYNSQAICLCVQNGYVIYAYETW